MSDDYRELRQALAAQPTTEPWYHCQPYQTIGPLQTIHGPVKKMRVDFVSAQQAPVHRKIIVPMPCGDCGLGVSSSVMGYIAAANPETVSRLLGEIDTLRAENERLVKEVEHWREARRTALLAGDVLKAENERLRQDAERYRYIRSNINAVRALVGLDAAPRLVGGELEELGRYCDECIDDVMRNSGRVSDE